MQEPLPLFRATPGGTWERLYWFFVEAEEDQSILTSVKIQQVFLNDEGEARDLDGVRWYMYRYWRWFLFCVNDRVKPYQYLCRNIKDYPLDYFLQAHTIPDRMQYLIHFVRSIEIDKELRKQAVGRGQPRKPRQQEDQVQQSLDEGVELEGQQQDDLDIQIDTHEEEEGPIQESTDGGFVVDAGGQEVENEVQQSPVEPDHGGDQQTPTDEEILLVPPHHPSPPSPPDTRPKPVPPWVLVGIVLAVCIAVAAYFFLTKQTR